MRGVGPFALTLFSDALKFDLTVHKLPEELAAEEKQKQQEAGLDPARARIVAANRPLESRAKRRKLAKSRLTLACKTHFAKELKVEENDVLFRFFRQSRDRLGLPQAKTAEELISWTAPDVETPSDSDDDVDLNTLLINGGFEFKVVKPKTLVAVHVSNKDWILCSVVSYDPQAQTYVVVDADPEERSDAPEHQVSRSLVIPLPEAAGKVVFSERCRVLAMFPGTTCFYPATVVGSRSVPGVPIGQATLVYALQFDDDEQDEFNRVVVKEVKAELVVAYQRVPAE